MSAHPIQWQAPEPLWGRFGASAEATVLADDQFRPAILRFASDDFMEQLLAMLARDPAQIGNLLARPETWRVPPGGDPAPGSIGKKFLLGVWRMAPPVPNIFTWRCETAGNGLPLVGVSP